MNQYDDRYKNKVLETSQCLKEEVHLRPIDSLSISPSKDIGEIAIQKSKDLHTTINFIMDLLGSKKQVADLMNYLQFVQKYCKYLVELARKDAKEKKEKNIDFLFENGGRI